MAAPVRFSAPGSASLTEAIRVLPQTYHVHTRIAGRNVKWATITSIQFPFSLTTHRRLPISYNSCSYNGVFQSRNRSINQCTNKRKYHILKLDRTGYKRGTEHASQSSELTIVDSCKTVLPSLEESTHDGYLELNLTIPHCPQRSTGRQLHWQEWRRQPRDGGTKAKPTRASRTDRTENQKTVAWKIPHTLRIIMRSDR